MRNRAKCKLCNSIIESFHPTDLVFCSCGEIGVDKGSSMKCIAKDWINFLRIDDQDNIIVPKIADANVKEDVDLPKPNREDLFKLLDAMIQNLEELPPSAMSTPINHYDYYSGLLLFRELLRSF